MSQWGLYQIQLQALHKWVSAHHLQSSITDLAHNSNVDIITCWVRFYYPTSCATRTMTFIKPVNICIFKYSPLHLLWQFRNIEHFTVCGIKSLNISDSYSAESVILNKLWEQWTLTQLPNTKPTSQKMHFGLLVALLKRISGSLPQRSLDGKSISFVPKAF